MMQCLLLIARSSGSEIDNFVSQHVAPRADMEGLRRLTRRFQEQQANSKCAFYGSLRYISCFVTATPSDVN